MAMPDMRAVIPIMRPPAPEPPRARNPALPMAAATATAPGQIRNGAQARNAAAR